MSLVRASGVSSLRLSRRTGVLMTYIAIDKVPGAAELTHALDPTPRRFRGRRISAAEAVDGDVPATSRRSVVSISKQLGIEPRVGDRIADGDLSEASPSELLAAGDAVVSVDPRVGRWIVEVDR